MTPLDALREFFARHPRILEWGVASTNRPPNSDHLKAWVDKGYHGSMDYMSTRIQERMSPRDFHPWAKSTIVFSFPYARPLGGRPKDYDKENQTTIKSYRVASYAGQTDYHKEARNLIHDAEIFLKTHLDNPSLPFYGFVDTAPVFERDLASEAGLGWRGKNCCTLNRTHGSAFHLAGFFLDLELPQSTPIEEFCGGCTRCIDQCPTEAFLGPGIMDANKCISYWTIEAKEAISPNLSNRFGGWIFGCDTCQDVCPWNHKSIEAGKATETNSIFPESGLEWIRLLRKSGGFQSRFKRSPLTRAGRKSLLRNLAIAAVNLKDTSLLPAFIELLPEENDPEIRKQIEFTIQKLKNLEENKI